MSLFKWMKGGSTQRRSHKSTDAQTQTPCFERLEDRILLSADASFIHDIHPLDTELEQVISVDLEPGLGTGSQTAECGVEEKAEDSGTVGQSDSPTVEQSNGLSVSQIKAAANLGSTQQNEIQPSPADDAAEAVKPNTQHLTPNTDATTGSINPRGPPAAEVSDSLAVSVNSLLDNQLQENTAPENLVETQGPGDVRIGDLEGDSVVIAENEVLRGSGSYAGEVIVEGTYSPGNSPGITTHGSGLTLTSGSTTIIEIDGTAGAGLTNGWDQIQVTGDVVLDGELSIVVAASPTPGLSLGDKFEILTYTGSVTGDFQTITGTDLGNGLYLSATKGADSYVLEVQFAPARPLIFIPGFGGTFAAGATVTALNTYLLNRGIAPGLLTLEPFAKLYDNIVQSFDNIGYTENTDLFTALWDWRVPVALDVSAYDGASPTETFDGELATVTGSSLYVSDPTTHTFESGLHYLAYYLDLAATSWANKHGTRPDSIDLVTHSTGGLLARSYIQSAAYNALYGGITDRALPLINDVVQVGVPNQGASGTFNLLQNNFSQKLESRLAARAFALAMELLETNSNSISNPDGTSITKTAFDAQVSANGQAAAERWFVQEYAGVLQDLLPTYGNALDLGSGFGLLNETSAGIENKLLLDLNYGTDPNAWIDDLSAGGQATIVYGSEVDTEDRLVKQTGPDLSLGLENEILPFDQYIGNWPGESEVWYQNSESNASGTEGDSTVPTISAAGLFTGDATRLGNNSLNLLEIRKQDIPVALSLPDEPVSHSGLTNNVYAQLKIIETITGNLANGASISNNLELSQFDSAQEIINRGIIDLGDFAQELFNRLPELTVDVASTASAELSLLFDLALQSVTELLEGYSYSGFC